MVNQDEVVDIVLKSRLTIQISRQKRAGARGMQPSSSKWKECPVKGKNVQSLMGQLFFPELRLTEFAGRHLKGLFE